MTLVKFYLDDADPNDIYTFVYKLNDDYKASYLYSYMHGDKVTQSVDNGQVSINDITGDDGGVYYEDENYMGSD